MGRLLKRMLEGLGIRRPPLADAPKIDERRVIDRAVTLTDLEHAVAPVRDELDQIARDLEEVRRGMNRLLSQFTQAANLAPVGQEPKPHVERVVSGGPGATMILEPVTEPSGEKVVEYLRGSTEPLAEWAGESGAGTGPREPAAEVRPLADLIIASFDSVDRESNRNQAAARAGFVARLGSRVQRIEFIDGAVLFYNSSDTAYVHPWPNQRLGHTWLSHFRLSRGANYPVLHMETLALARECEGGEWECLQKGYAKNDD
jgi:hypothetical protein